MSLFDWIPAELFRPLAAPGARIYADILLALFDETQRRQQALSREATMHRTTAALADLSAPTLECNSLRSKEVRHDLAPHYRIHDRGHLGDSRRRVARKFCAR